MQNTDTYGGNEGINPLIINLVTVRNWVVSFLTWKFYPILQMLQENQYKTDALPTQVGSLVDVVGSSVQVDL